MKALGWVFHVRFPVLRIERGLITLYMKDDYSPTYWGNMYKDFPEMQEACSLHYIEHHNQHFLMHIASIPVYTRKPAPS